MKRRRTSKRRTSYQHYPARIMASSQGAFKSGVKVRNLPLEVSRVKSLPGSWKARCVVAPDPADRTQGVATDSRLQASYLVELADFTEVLAKKEAALVAPLGIPKARLDSLADLKSTLTAATKDRALASADAQSATTSQDTALAKAKSWSARRSSSARTPTTTTAASPKNSRRAATPEAPCRSSPRK